MAGSAIRASVPSPPSSGAAAERDDRLRSLLDNMPNIVFCRREPGVDAATALVYGRDAEKILGPVEQGMVDIGRWYRAIHPDDRARHRRLDRRRALSGQGYTIEFRFPDPATGEFRWARETAWAVEDTASGRRFLDSYILDITEDRSARLALQEAKIEAETASRAKSELLAHVSHELRTPLNAISGLAEMMQQEVLAPIGHPRYREYVDDIQRSARHLLKLIDDLLDAARIEAGRLELQEGVVDAGTLVRETLGLLGGHAGHRRVALEAEIAGGLALRADERALGRVLLNLVGNAIKFTEPGGRVVVRGGLDGDGWATLSVEDSGIGIPAEEIGRVVEPFAQASNARRSGEAGTGLGLAIARSLVELHGGRLTLESRIGAGTNVTIRLPPERCFGAADAAPP